MSFEGIQINKVQGGIGNAGTGRVAALLVIGGCTNTYTGIMDDTSQIFSSTKEAKTKGITDELDLSEGVFVRRHIDMFFAQAPDATLHLILLNGNQAVDVLDAVSAYLVTSRGSGVTKIGVAWSSNNNHIKE